MIYNFFKYLTTEFPAEKFYVNNKIIISGETEVDDRMIILIEQPGERQPWFGLITTNIQVLVRDNDGPGARSLAYKIYNKIIDDAEFGKILPAETVGGVLFPAIQIDQITPFGPPQSLGMNEEKKAEFTSNYKIIYRRT